MAGALSVLLTAVIMVCLIGWFILSSLKALEIILRRVWKEEDVSYEGQAVSMAVSLTLLVVFLFLVGS